MRPVCLIFFCSTLWAIDFQRDVKPILANHCYQCHGPDAANRQAGLRLDTREGALSKVVVAGNPDGSLLVKRISEEKLSLRMPPPYAHKDLSAAEVNAPREWVASGANWKEHWSFIPPVKPSLPAVSRPEWVRNPIDSFVLARLDKEKLSPAPPADRARLIRRLSLDLTGLPPSPEEVDAFVQDKRGDAYERVVDRYLASPHWGEHRARYWLDAARYGDTHGLHSDNRREIWPWRDWVIQAYNRNLPFDQFTLEQLAGDLLPNPTVDQRIADYGRDHHPRCFTMWMAGGGMKAGASYGETDEFSYNVVRDPVHVRDPQATILHVLGIDHTRLTYPYQGLDQKLTGVEKARVVQEVLS